MRIDNAVRSVLTDEWRTGLEIFKLHGYGAPTTTAGQLNVLAQIGEIEWETRPIPSGGFVYVYRRKQS